MSEFAELLQRLGFNASLPVLEINGLPPGSALEGDPLKQALIAGAAPEPLRPMIEEIDYGDEYGVEVTLRGGIPIRFGTGGRSRTVIGILPPDFRFPAGESRRDYILPFEEGLETDEREGRSSIWISVLAW